MDVDSTSIGRRWTSIGHRWTSIGRRYDDGTNKSEVGGPKPLWLPNREIVSFRSCVRARTHARSMEGWLSPCLVCGTATGWFCSGFAFFFLFFAFCLSVTLPRLSGPGRFRDTTESRAPCYLKQEAQRKEAKRREATRKEAKHKIACR